jgi:hypothetical protein
MRVLVPTFLSRFRLFFQRHVLKVLKISINKKAHGLFWQEDIDRNAVFWLSPGQRDQAMRAAISRRTIPFLPEWLPAIEQILIEQEIFIPLHGWGDVEGYAAMWNDEQVCDLIVEKIFKTKTRPIKKAA